LRLAVEHYLAGLTERGELDVLLRNLLIADGYEVLKRASRGEKEYGVDLAATRQEGDGVHLYLFQVKRGDLDRTVWDVGPNSVRASLNEALDEPYASFLKLPGPPVKRHLIVVFNGEVKEDARRQFDNFAREQCRWRPDTEITFWNISTLVGRVEGVLIGEGLVPDVDTLLLKKTLAFADVPQYAFGELTTLLKALTGNVPSIKAAPVRRLFATVRLLTRMVAEYARRGGAYRNAILASEITLLILADWCTEREVFRIRELSALYARQLEDYLADLRAVRDRLEPALYLEHGLALGGMQEIVEYPLRTFEVLGWLALHVLVALHLGETEEAERTCDLIALTINRNPAAARPLLDNHGIEIGLVALAFAYCERQGEAARYASHVLQNLQLRKQLGRPLPELYNNVGAVLEEAASGTRPVEFEDSSSTLIPLLLELLLWDGDERALRSFAGAFKGVNLQTWYPPPDYAPAVFSQELRGGFAETGLEVPPEREAFVALVRDRLVRFEQDLPVDAFSDRVSGIALFVASRYLRTPMFPSVWREWIPELMETVKSSAVEPDGRRR